MKVECEWKEVKFKAIDDYIWEICYAEFDEPESALDVSIQAQVLNLLNDLKKQLGFTILSIAHKLSVVKYFSDYIMVMNNEHLAEQGIPEEIYSNLILTEEELYRYKHDFCSLLREEIKTVE